MKGSFYLKVLFLLSGLLITTNIYSIADPPTITWTNPSREYTALKSNRISIKAIIRSASGIKSVYIYLNNTLYGEPEMVPVFNEAGAFEVRKTITLVPGENIIYLVATNGEGSASSEKRYVTIPLPVSKIDSTTANPRITWRDPRNEKTEQKSNKTVIEAIIQSKTGLNSVVIYLNDVLYGEPEMTALLTEPGAYIVSKAINLVEGENSILIVATNKDGSTNSEKRYFTVSTQVSRVDSVPQYPVITWSDPQKETTTLRSARATIRAKIYSISGLKSVVIYLNDILYGEPELTASPTIMGGYEITKTLNLNQGENRLYLVAINDAGSATSDKRNFTVPVSVINNDSLAAIPKISWLVPLKPRTNLVSPKTEIKATVKFSSDLKSVMLYLNNMPYGVPETLGILNKPGTFTLNKTLNLKPGENSIYIVAASSKGCDTSEIVYFSVPLPARVLDSLSALQQPPSVTWEIPAEKSISLKTSSTEIKATVKSPTALNSVILYLNGTSLGSVEVSPSDEAPNTYLIERALSFKQIENKVYLTATNMAGETISESRSFLCPISSLQAGQPTNRIVDNAAPNPPSKTDGAQTVTSPVTTEKTASKSLAPIITWTSPSGLKTTMDSFNATVKARIESDTDLKSVLFYLNGISKGPVDIKLSNEGPGTYTIEKNLNFGPGENIIYLVATNNEGSVKSEERFFTNPAGVPPLISWSNPEAVTSLVNTESLRISACIKSPTELKSVKLLVNGNILAEDNVFQASDNIDCNYSWQSTVVLREGDNSIFIIASNVAGSTTSEKRAIKFQPALSEKRIALVIGNSQYKNKNPLKNPVNDANLMEGTLKALGFEVIKRLNAGKEEMMTAIREFERKLPDNNIALFYYAGHGNQVDGKNYLIPTDATLETPSDCKFEAVEVNLIVEEFERYQDNTNIVILDACRDNPYASWARGSAEGFKMMSFTSGTIVAFATSEGATAADGIGANGLYTQELVKQMMVPQSISSVFMNTRAQVRKLSNNRQIPTEINKLNGDFFLRK